MRDFPRVVFPCVDLPHLDYPCVDIPPVEGRRNTWFALWAVFPYVGISEYDTVFKSRLQRKKIPKIDLYPDSKSFCLSTHLGQRKPPVPQTDSLGHRDRRFGFSDCSRTDGFVSFFIQGCHYTAFDLKATSFAGLAYFGFFNACTDSFFLTISFYKTQVKTRLAAAS